MSKSIVSEPSWIDKMNDLGQRRIPFIFILDFELKKPVILNIGQITEDIYYKFNDVKNYQLSGIKQKNLQFDIFPINYKKYAEAFDRVIKEIQFGNSFLLNLTFATEIKTNYSLKELFDISHAKYKLYFKDEFIVSSPEPNAEKIILNDLKETAEHYTIVDLLRNDLSLVAKNVKVNKFRYIDHLTTLHRTLLQVSSEIEGTLPNDFRSKLGDIFMALLPAGSVSGAPKKKTLEIIAENESDSRGYYTGVFGIFDGENVDSAVMIRYIEKSDDRLWYRSGCGITNQSECASEYKEMIDKVYVPIGRKH